MKGSNTWCFWSCRNPNLKMLTTTKAKLFQHGRNSDSSKTEPVNDHFGYRALTFCLGWTSLAFFVVSTLKFGIIISYPEEDPYKCVRNIEIEDSFSQSYAENVLLTITESKSYWGMTLLWNVQINEMAYIPDEFFSNPKNYFLYLCYALWTKSPKFIIFQATM